MNIGKFLLTTTLALSLLSSLDAYAAKKDGSTDDAVPASSQQAGGKVDICHHTGSEKNPWVLISVSANAKQAHYDHGDPLSFTDLGKNKCAPATPAAPTVDLTLAATTIDIQATTTAQWTSTNAQSCQLGTTPVALNGSATVGPYSAAGTQIITITCTGAGGTATDSATLTVRAASGPPSVNLELSHATLTAGTAFDIGTTQAEVSWTALNVTVCRVNGAGLDGTFGASGLEVVGPFSSAGTHTISIQCDGVNGGTASDSAQLTVVLPPAPTVSLTLSPAQLIAGSGATTTVGWSSSNAASCTLNGNSVPLTGSQVQGPYTTAGSVPFSITCTNSIGMSATDSKTLTVIAGQAPTVQLSLVNSEILVNSGKTILTLTSAHVNACTVSGLPGTATTTGSGSSTLQVGTYATTGTKAILASCTGTNGSTVQATVNVNVVASLPPLQLCAYSALGYGSPANLVEWEIVYDQASGEFSGLSVDPDFPEIAGQATPSDGISFLGALFRSGTQLAFETGGGALSAEGRSPGAHLIEYAGTPDAKAYYTATLTGDVAASTDEFWFQATCLSGDR